MTKASKYTANRIKHLVSEAWGELYRACDKCKRRDASSWLLEAEEIALRQEKQHRAMGARFTHGQASYRVPASTAARSIIIHHVFMGYRGDCGFHVPETWAEACSIRSDCALAYAIRETIAAVDLAKLEDAALIDYAEDIAA